MAKSPFIILTPHTEYCTHYENQVIYSGCLVSYPHLDQHERCLSSGLSPSIDEVIILFLDEIETLYSFWGHRTKMTIVNHCSILPQGFKIARSEIRLNIAE